MDFDLLKEEMIERFHRKIVARDFMPVKSIEFSPRCETELIPVIERRVSFNEQLDYDAFYHAIDEIAHEEDKLTITGEHAHWNALGIEGLSTKNGRTSFASAQQWPKGVFKDVVDGRQILRKNFGENLCPILILPNHLFSSLENIAWKPPEWHSDIQPKTHLNILLDEKLVMRVYSTDGLFAPDGGIDSALLYHSTRENYMAQALPLDIISLDEEGVTTLIIREAIGPIIRNPSAIVEITNIVYS